MAAWGLQEPMEPIPEEGDEWLPADSRNKTHRKREIFTSEQVDTLVTTVPQESVPPEWLVENEVVDPHMASSYVTESLAGPASARGTSYSYTYESHYDNPTEEIEEEDEFAAQKTHKVTRVTKVTTTRSVRQVPVSSPYSDLYFDASGLPTPNTVVAVPGTMDELGIRLRDEDRTAPPPAPALGSRYANVSDDSEVPGTPGTPDVIDTSIAEVTLVWSAPLPSGPERAVLGYQIEMRDVPDGEWERAHDQLLKDTSCTITNLDGCGVVQFRVSAAGRAGFGPPSAPSQSVTVPHQYEEQRQGLNGWDHGGGLAQAPTRPEVVSVDGHRATIHWERPVPDVDIPPVAGYQVEYRVYGTTDWIVANDTIVTEHRFTIENLRPNGVYEFRVRARNANGLGIPSRSSGATHIRPAAPDRGASARPVASDIPPPGQPQVVEADNDSVKLEWAGSRLGVGYVVEYREVGDPNWYTANPHPIQHLCIQVEGLRSGSTYEFRVISVLGGSASEPSEVSDIVSLRPMWRPLSGARGVPAAPEAPEYLDVDGDRITLCWLPAQSAMPVLGYDVEFRDFQQDNGWYKVNDQPVHACKMTVGDLIVGHEYQFRVLAHNVVGCSESSQPSAPVTIQPSSALGDAKYVEAERFGAVQLLQEEMVRESPPLPERDDSPPPLNRDRNKNNLQWRDPSLKEVIEYLDSPDKEKQKNASGYLQHLTYTDNLIKEETRELGGIPRLVRLLKSEMPAIQRNACACLKNLSYGKENERNKLAVLDADGVRMLSALLQTTADAAVKEEATAAIWNLSSTDLIKPAVLEAATDALVQEVVISGAGYQTNGLVNAGPQDTIKHYNSVIFKNSTGVLRNISAASAAARKRLRLCPNLIESLIHFLTIAIQRNQVDSPSVENVICLLRNLSYRIQEVEDPNYDPATVHLKGNKSLPNSPKPKRKEKDKKQKTKGPEPISGAAILWQPHVVRLYLKLLQEASNLDTLEASAGAVQNLAACQFAPSAEVRATVRVDKGLPVLVELIRLKEDYVVCAVATALRNLALDQRNKELIGKYALRDLVDKLPDAALGRRPAVSDQTIGAVLGILFEIVRSSVSFTRDLHEAKGTDKLRALARSFPMYSQRVCRYASQVLYMMWQHKELHDGFKRSGLKEADFYSGTSKRNDHSATLARPISSQGRERPALLDETASSGGGYGTMGHTEHTRPTYPTQSGANGHSEPVYASVRKPRGNDDSWV